MIKAKRQGGALKALRLFGAIPYFTSESSNAGHSTVFAS